MLSNTVASGHTQLLKFRLIKTQWNFNFSHTSPVASAGRAATLEEAGTEQFQRCRALGDFSSGSNEPAQTSETV